MVDHKGGRLETATRPGSSLKTSQLGCHTVPPRLPRISTTDMRSQRPMRLAERDHRNHDSRGVADRGHVLLLDIQLVSGERRKDPDGIEAHDPRRE